MTMRLLSVDMMGHQRASMSYGTQLARHDQSICEAIHSTKMRVSRLLDREHQLLRDQLVLT
jgi:hypothetical protein